MRLDQLTQDELKAVECAIEDTVEQCEAHLEWLDTPDGLAEDNRDEQRASTQRGSRCCEKYWGRDDREGCDPTGADVTPGWAPTPKSKTPPQRGLGLIESTPSSADWVSLARSRAEAKKFPPRRLATSGAGNCNAGEDGTCIASG